MRSQPASYHGYRFPPDIISHAVWLYHRFCLSFRDAEDLLAQRGVTVTYETIRPWCQRFGPVYARRLRRRRGRMGDTCTYGKPHTHGSRDRSRGRGAGERWQREHRGRALRERRRVAGVLRTFLRPPRGVHGLPAATVHGGRQAA